MVNDGVTLNKTELGKWLRSQAAADACLPTAERVRANAANLAPRSGRPGTLRPIAHSHRVDVNFTGKRARVFVTADTPYAARMAVRDNWLARALTASSPIRGGGR